MFEIVGNSATQIYNKEISLSLSLSLQWEPCSVPRWCKYKISFDGWARHQISKRVLSTTVSNLASS